MKNLKKLLKRKKLEVLVDPHPILRKVSLPVEDFSLMLKLKDKMVDSMRESRGIGLAAPQVGISLRLFVMDIYHEGSISETMILINPEILNKKGVAAIEEGCLSIPGKNILVDRSEEVEVKYFNEQGEEKVRKFDGIPAICVQHELDHLNGVLMTDYLRREDEILKK